MTNLVHLAFAATCALVGPAAGDLPNVVRLERPVIASHGESAAFVLVARDPERGFRSSVVWAERDRSTEGSTTFRRASVLRLPGAPSVGLAVSAVHAGQLAQSGDGRLLAFHGTVRDADTGDKSSGLVVTQIVDKPGEPGSFAHRAVRVYTVAVGESVDDCTRLTFVPERPRLFVLGAKHVLAVDLKATCDALVAGPVEIVDRADDGTPADSARVSACFGESVETDATGRFVVYGSDATNLDPERRARGFAIYVTDLDPAGTGRLEVSNRRTLLVSLDREGRFLEGSRGQPRISADGRFVVAQSSTALSSERVIGGYTDTPASTAIECVLYDLDADCDGAIGNTLPRPYLWRRLVADEPICTRATSRGWLVTHRHGWGESSFGIFALATDGERPVWEPAGERQEWPSRGEASASFDGRWLVGCRALDGESPDHLGEYLLLRRVP